MPSFWTYTTGRSLGGAYAILDCQDHPLQKESELSPLRSVFLGVQLVALRSLQIVLQMHSLPTSA